MAKSGEMGFTGGSSIWAADCCGVVDSANPETGSTCQYQQTQVWSGEWLRAALGGGNRRVRLYVGVRVAMLAGRR